MEPEASAGKPPKGFGEKRVSLSTAVAAVSGTLVLVLAVGLLIGYSLFWNRYDRTSRLDAEVVRWSQALEKEPANFQAHYQLGWTLYQQGKLAKALEHTQSAAELQSEHAGVQYNLGLIYFDMKRYEEAEGQFRALAEQYPRHEQAWLSLGRTYLEMDRISDAVETLEQTLRINSTSSDTRFSLGLAYERMGGQDEAIGEYQEALRFNPNFEPAAQALNRLGVTGP